MYRIFFIFVTMTLVAICDITVTSPQLAAVLGTKEPQICKSDPADVYFSNSFFRVKSFVLRMKIISGLDTCLKIAVRAFFFRQYQHFFKF